MGCGSSMSANDQGPASSMVTLKLAFSGDPGVGKTSLCVRYCQNSFSDVYSATTELGLYCKMEQITYPYRFTIQALIKDCPGRESGDLSKTYYSDIDAAIVVVDLTEPSTLQLAGTWRQQILNASPLDNHKQPQILLLGNKYDLAKAQLQRNEEQTATQTDETEQNTNNNHNDGEASIKSTDCPIAKNLEAVAKQHGFTDSAVVSAKENSGALSAVMRSFLLHVHHNNSDNSDSEDEGEEELEEAMGDAIEDALKAEGL